MFFFNFYIVKLRVGVPDRVFKLKEYFKPWSKLDLRFDNKHKRLLCTTMYNVFDPSLIRDKDFRDMIEFSIYFEYAHFQTCKS